MRKLTRLIREEKKACAHWFSKACVKKRPPEEDAYDGYIIPVIAKTMNDKNNKNYKRRKFV